jgi:hypothetical protein
MASFDFLNRNPPEREIRKFREYYEAKPRLNLGSNNDLRSDYINVDIEDIPDLDVRANVLNMPFLPIAKAEEILAYDLLEHLP